MVDLVDEEMGEDGTDRLAIGDAVVAIDRHDAVEIGLGQRVAEGDQLAVDRRLSGGKVDCAGEENIIFFDLPPLPFRSAR